MVRRQLQKPLSEIYNLSLNWRVATHHSSVHQPHMFCHIVTFCRSVQKTPIVPHHQITRAPDMAVNKSVLGRKNLQFLQQRLAHTPDHVRRMGGVCTDIKAFAPRLWMGPDKRMDHRWRILDFLSSRQLTARFDARLLPAMNHTKRGNFIFLLV